MQEPWLLPVLMFGGFLIFFGVILRMAAITSRKAVDNVRHLAEQMRLTMKENRPVLGFCRSPEATGTIRGKAVRLYNYTTGSGKSKTTWAAVAVAPAAHGNLTFKLSHQGFGTKVMELFGAKEIKVGDMAFDRDWFIQTNAPDFFGAALLPEMQRKIQLNKGTWKLADGMVVYSERGSFADERRCARFVSVVDAACDLADIAEVYAQHAQGR
ncbi:MAG: hypothetical protein K9M98_00300 [Cephaloticoccus sp.]|nr:hypothetical protein [Cephaloticoccus sp.]MCF7758923.1 hypothetical protein [Cephaloticoccus sp.]